MNRFVASMWFACAAVFGAGVLILAQSNLNNDSNGDGTALLQHQRVHQVIAADKRLEAVGANLAAADPASDEVQGPTAGAAVPAPKQAASGDQALQPPAPPAPDAVQGYLTVTGEDAVMRPRPDQSSPMMFAFPVGRQLAVIQQTGDGWTEAEDPRSHATGWIASDQLGQSGPSGQVASLAVPQQQASADDGDDGDFAMPIEGRHRHGHRNGPIASFFRRAFGR